MARETLKDFLTSLGSGADSISYRLRDDTGDGSFGEGDDLGVDPNTGKELIDFSDNATGLLGDYVNFIQDNHDVIFNVSPGSTEAISPVRGSPLTPSNSGVDRPFVDTSSSSPLSVSLVEYSNSGKFDQETVTLGSLIDKESGKDGHDLLSTVSGKDIGSDGQLSVTVPRVFPSSPAGDKEKELINASVNILRNNNRFSPAGDAVGDAFVERGKLEEEFEEEDVLSTQREFGEYDRHSVKVNLTSLAKIGESLINQSIRWTGNDESPPESGLGSSNPVEKISPFDLRAKNAEGFPARGIDQKIEDKSSIRAGRGEFLSADPTESSNSFGAMTGPDEQSFDPSSTAFLKARAVIALKSALVAIESFKKIALKASAGPNSKIDTSRGILLSGEGSFYARSRMSVIMNSILVPTDRPYLNCVNAGAKFMLGLDKALSNIDSVAALEGQKIGSSKIVKTSPGFSLVLARSILRSVHVANQLISKSTREGFDPDDAERLINRVGDSRVFGILNSLAIVGDIRLKIKKSKSGKFGIPRGSHPWSVDDLPDGPSTRVSKSRTSDGFNAGSLSMRTSATPSAYILPAGVFRSVVRMGMGEQDVNPAKLLASPMGKKMYAGLDIENGKRIPSTVVRRLEDLLDSEYVPFYFHDIRTNEIISFHAFLDTLSDSYTASFSDTGGYGRMDNVQIYNSTKRDIGLSFTIASTSEEDFDEMWFKINKLVTLVYPQWSAGDSVGTYRSLGSSDATFTQPFSQVIGATPLIRLRVGDVIKSNYSKFNLSRIFGVGNQLHNMDLIHHTMGSRPGEGFAAAISNRLTNAADELMLKIFLGVMGSPISTLNAASGKLIGSDRGGASMLGSAMANPTLQLAASKLLENGFANPILGLILGQYSDPDGDPTSVISTKGNLTANAGAALQSKVDNSNSGYRPTSAALSGPAMRQVAGNRVFIKASQSKPYRVVADSAGNDLSTVEKVRFNRPVLGVILSRYTEGVSGRSDNANDKARRRTVYRVAIIDLNVPKDFFGCHITINHSDIIHDPNIIFNRFMMPLLNPAEALVAGVKNLVNKGAAALGVDSSELSQFLSGPQGFMSSERNVITRGFESTRGRGLAGVIKNIKFDWMTEETTWEINWGSRAPKMCRVSIGFTPIHDIPPGIDREGFNRAPIYNVGKAAGAMSGDVYDDGGQSSRETYEFEHRKTFKNE